MYSVYDVLVVLISLVVYSVYDVLVVLISSAVYSVYDVLVVLTFSSLSLKYEELLAWLFVALLFEYEGIFFSDQCITSGPKSNAFLKTRGSRSLISATFLLKMKALVLLILHTFARKRRR